MIEPSDQLRMFGEHGRMLPEFDGATYSRPHDKERLTGQIEKVFNLIKDGQWRTLTEISDATGQPQASVSTRLRDFRKARFGAHTVEKRPRGERNKGLYEYRIILNPKAT